MWEFQIEGKSGHKMSKLVLYLRCNETGFLSTESDVLINNHYKKNTLLTTIILTAGFVTTLKLGT